MNKWDDEKKIRSVVNSMRAAVMIGHQKGWHVSIRASRFTGVKTIGLFWIKDKGLFHIECDFIVEEGQGKLVLVKKDTVTYLASATCHEMKLVNLERGFVRLRLVGERASLSVKATLAKSQGIMDENI
jgi:hypothetical protein